MKSIIEKLLKKIKRHSTSALALLALATSLIMPTHSEAQIGTYVNPRVYPLWSGTLTNGQSLTNIFVGTNFLNYSGFHRMGLWATYASTNAGNFNSNTVLTVDLSPGTGGGYTNSVLGTNLIYTTGGPISWTIPCNGTTNTVIFTNLDWNVSDSTLYLRGTKLATQSTNALGFQLEIDMVVTP